MIRHLVPQRKEWVACMQKSLLSLLLLSALIITTTSQTHVWADDPPPANPTEEIPYTTEEFSALADKEKRDTYLYNPMLLPENFTPEHYPDAVNPLPDE